MRLYCLAVDRTLSGDEFSELLGSLPTPAVDRISRITHRDTAIRALLGEMLARSVLAQHAGGTASDLEISLGPHGKPELASSSWRHNVSHSGDWVICAVSDSQPVGVDVERMRDPDLRIARRYFHPRECERVMNAPEADRTGAFFDVWTTKESFLKAVGIGISVALNSFWADDDTRTIRIADPEPFARLGVEIESGWCFDLLPLDDDHRLAACSQVREQHDLVRLGVDELLRHR